MRTEQPPSTEILSNLQNKKILERPLYAAFCFVITLVKMLLHHHLFKKEFIMTHTHTTKLLIIGSGPAGATAGIYGARALLDPIMVRGPQPGGQLTITTEVENWPGIFDIQGPDLTVAFEAHAQHAGTKIIEGIITHIEGDASPYIAHLDNGDTIEAEALILAMGSQAKWLGIEGEEKYKGYGVSACATCDGFFFKNQEISVIGGGNTALEEALFLTRFASKVHIIHRRDTFKAEKILQKRVFENDKIEIHWDTKVNEIKGVEGLTGQKSVTGLELSSTKNDTHTEFLDCTGVFVAIGHNPSSGIVKDIVQTDEFGYILTGTKTTSTNKPGIFAAGDITDPIYRQAVTSSGMGCMAALDAEKWLSEKDI
jgi:thioredoxin reductase (NADPH)